MGITRYLAALLLVSWVLVSVFAFLFPPNISDINLAKIAQPPEKTAWLGYDELGRAILPRLIAGAKTALLIATSVVLSTLFLGSSIGIIAAWYGGFVDKSLLILIDLFMAFPGILLAIAFAGLLGPGIINTALALILVSWVGFARLARAQTLRIKQAQHVEAAIVLGNTPAQIATKHVLPLILPPLIVEATFAVSGVIIAEASLSFLGLGVQPPGASLGSMIREGTRYMLISPHMALIPGITISLVVVAINILGDYISDRLEKKANNST